MSGFRIDQLPDGFGAEVVGLHEPLSAEDERRLKSAFDETGLLLFRGLFAEPTLQTHLVHLFAEDQGTFDESSGRLDTQDVYVSNKEKGAGVPFGRLLFHTDLMWSDSPYHVTSLGAVEVEPPVAPTYFVSTALAWQSLPAELRAKVEKCDVLHINDATSRHSDSANELLHVVYERPSGTTTPLALVHPRTGQTVLYASEMMTESIVGMEAAESEAVLQQLFAHLYDPQRVWQYVWENGDLIIWDNFLVQHARSDIRSDGPVRTLRKVSSSSMTRGTAGAVTYARTSG